MANGFEHFADDLVGVMLALADFADMLMAFGAALKQAPRRIRSGEHGDGMRLEQFEKPTRFRKKSLEPGKHRTHFRFFGDHGKHPRAFRRLVEFAGPERPDQVGEIGFVDRCSRRRQAEPAPLALGLLGPVVEFAIDRQGKHLDVGHQRGAAALALAISEGAERHGTDRTDHASLLHRFLGGAGVGRHPARQIALWDHPALGFARRDKQHGNRQIERWTRRPIRKSCNLSDSNPPKDAGAPPAGRHRLRRLPASFNKFDTFVTIAR